MVPALPERCEGLLAARVVVWIEVENPKCVGHVAVLEEILVHSPRFDLSGTSLRDDSQRAGKSVHAGVSARTGDDAGKVGEAFYRRRKLSGVMSQNSDLVFQKPRAV